MQRNEYVYSDEATILSTQKDICLIHQIIAPTLVTAENISQIKESTKSDSVELGQFVGAKEDVIKVYMTVAHARQLIVALQTALDKKPGNQEDGGENGSSSAN